MFLNKFSSVQGSVAQTFSAEGHITWSLSRHGSDQCAIAGQKMNRLLALCHTATYVLIDSHKQLSIIVQVVKVLEDSR